MSLPHPGQQWKLERDLGKQRTKFENIVTAKRDKRSSWTTPIKLSLRVVISDHQKYMYLAATSILLTAPFAPNPRVVLPSIPTYVWEVAIECPAKSPTAREILSTKIGNKKRNMTLCNAAKSLWRMVEWDEGHVRDLGYSSP
jgi:hypothetical protein